MAAGSSRSYALREHVLLIGKDQERIDRRKGIQDCLIRHEHGVDLAPYGVISPNRMFRGRR